MKKFRLTLKHDNGKFNISTYADTEEAAREKVIAAENCPARAIVKVKQVQPEKNTFLGENWLNGKYEEINCEIDTTHQVVQLGNDFFVEDHEAAPVIKAIHKIWLKGQNLSVEEAICIYAKQNDITIF